MENQNYFSGLIGGIKSLCTGLKVTMREFWTPKITERYPENRKELVMFDRFRGQLILPHNEENQHKCVGCGICQMVCPNDSIVIETEMVETEDGKKKKILARHIYDQGRCMYCMLCTRGCPHGALDFDNNFEYAVFDRSKLVKQLNHPGSTVQPKK